MKQTLTSYLDSVLTILLFVVAGLTPLFFLNLTTEFYEIPKLIFLIIMTILMLGVWIFSWIVKGKVVITRTPLDIPLLLLLGVVILSTYFSDSRFTALYGNFPRVHGSAISYAVYILLYFVAVSQLRSLAKIKSFLYVLYGSGVVVSLLSLLSFFGLYLPLAFAKAVNFTPTGSTFSTVAFLLLLLPLPLLSVVNVNKYVPSSFALPLAIIFSLTIILIGSIPSYVVLLIIYALVAFVSQKHLQSKTLPLIGVPVIVTIAALFLAYVPFPGNFIQKMETAFPREIQLPIGMSWKVSASVFRDAPFVGTGPGTFLYNFTSYKPTEFNAANFWNFSFDSAYNEYLQALGTLGVLGLILLLVISVYILGNSLKNLNAAEHEEGHDRSQIFTTGLAISGLTSVMLLAIHATTLVSLVMSLLIVGAYLMSQKSIREKVLEVSAGLNATTAGNTQFNLLPVIIFLVFLIGIVPFLYKMYQAVAADYYHRLALTNASKSGASTYEFLQRAEAMNPYIDLYRVDMAQTNFALANAIAINKGPNKDNPKGSLTDQDKRTIQTLLSQSVNEGRVAVALSPRSSRNWEVLASTYRNITGIAQNALAFALDGYGKAIQRDPINPALRINVGGIYYSVKNYDLAIRFFTDAANLKPDYPTAYYNLSIALRDKGDLQNSQAVAEQLVNILSKNQDTPDYKLATAYLKDLKAKIATNSANLNAQGAPAGQTNSNLGNVGGVDVNNLNNPPTPATPAAVTRNPRTNLPASVQATPAPRR